MSCIYHISQPVEQPYCIQTCECNTPLGTLLLGAYGDNLCLCEWKQPYRPSKILDRLSHHLYIEFSAKDNALLHKASTQIDEYLKRKRTVFELSTILIGTSFQKEVWNALRHIPYGITTSYRDLAHSIRRPKAIRAVANAIGSNPLSIIIPCHRVIGSDGSLTGYAGGIDTKSRLLELENQDSSLMP